MEFHADNTFSTRDSVFHLARVLTCLKPAAKPIDGNAENVIRWATETPFSLLFAAKCCTNQAWIAWLVDFDGMERSISFCVRWLDSIVVPHFWSANQCDNVHLILFWHLTKCSLSFWNGILFGVFPSFLEILEFGVSWHSQSHSFANNTHCNGIGSCMAILYHFYIGEEFRTLEVYELRRAQLTPNPFCKWDIWAVRSCENAHELCLDHIVAIDSASDFSNCFSRAGACYLSFGA